MKKRLLTTSLCSVALLLLAGLTSCDHKELLVPESKYNGDKGSLVININSGTVGTRATNYINDANDPTANEKTITTLAIGIYRTANSVTASEDGAQVDFIYDGGVNADAATGYTKKETIKRPDAAKPTFSKKVEAGDIVLVAINVTPDVKDKLEAAASPADFRAVASSIDQALAFEDGLFDGSDAILTSATTPAYAANDRSVDAKKLPMYGEASVTGDDTNGYVANVQVRHMVAKVTLNSVTLDTPTGTFTLEEVFLRNVADNLDFAFSNR